MNSGIGGDAITAATRIAGNGGAINITAGAAGGNGGGSATGGNIILSGGGNSGNTGNTNGGSIYLVGGVGSNAGVVGNVFLATNTSGSLIGKVGIGTTAPGFTQSIDLATASGSSNALADGLLIRSHDTANGIELRHGSSTGFLAMNPDTSGSGALGIGTKGAYPLHFYTNAGLSAGTASLSGLAMTLDSGGDLGLGHASDQVHVKVDLNCFSAPKTTSERIPINQNQLSFVIKTYNMSNLMASKIVAIFLREERIVGSDVFGEKGRDIYDLLWYMEKKIIPDLDYLKAKGVSVSSLQNLFDKLTLKMNEVTQKNLEDDLKPLFTDGAKISYWLQHWHESYLHLLKSYPIRQVTEIEMVRIHQDFHSDNYSFIYYYKTTDTHRVTFVATVSDYWIEFGDGNIPTVMDESLMKYVDTAQPGEPSDKVKQFATLFYQKIESYLAKTNREVLSDHIKTKIMRTTADNLNREEQIVLTKSALLSCEFDDLLK